MSILGSIVNEEEHTSRAKFLKGVVCGVVTDNDDPKKLGRVRVRFPWISDDNKTDWARVVVPMAGPNRGHYFIPEIDDEVLVAFEHSDVNRPLVIGSLWNLSDKTPDGGPDPKNNIKKYVSRAGHELIFEDTEGEEKVTIITQGNHRILLDDTPNAAKIEVFSNAGHHLILDDASGGEKITLKDKTGNNFVEIDSVKNSMTIESKTELSIKSAKIMIKADTEMTIESGGMLTIKGAMVKIN